MIVARSGCVPNAASILFPRKRRPRWGLGSQALHESVPPYRTSAARLWSRSLMKSDQDPTVFKSSGSNQVELGSRSVADRGGRRGEKWGPSVPGRILPRFLHFPSAPRGLFGTFRKVGFSSCTPGLGRLDAWQHQTQEFGNRATRHDRSAWSRRGTFAHNPRCKARDDQCAEGKHPGDGFTSYTCSGAGLLMIVGFSHLKCQAAARGVGILR